MTKTETGFQDLKRASGATASASAAPASRRIIPAGRPVPRRTRTSWRPLYIGVIGA